MGVKGTRAAAQASADLLLTDRQASELLNIGLTRLFELQQEPDFPAPIWLGPRAKRHVRDELLAFALKRRR